MSENLLTAQGLVKRFESRDVLKNVSLTLEKGETAAVIGASGAGKSTLLRCLCELERVDEGTIEIGGQVMTGGGRNGYAPEKELRRIRRRMGYVFQDFQLFPHFSVLRNVTEAQRCVLGRGRKEAEERARALLDRMALSDKADTYPCFLSGGQRQRLAIARMLAMDPDILCFDEPTSALDPQLTKEVLQVIRSLADEGRTMLIITHEMAFAREAAGRIFYMADGQILCEGTPEDVFADPRVRAFAQTE